MSVAQGLWHSTAEREVAGSSPWLWQPLFNVVGLQKRPCTVHSMQGKGLRMVRVIPKAAALITALCGCGIFNS